MIITDGNRHCQKWAPNYGILIAIRPSDIRRLRFILSGLRPESLNSVHTAHLGVTLQI